MLASTILFVDDIEHAFICPLQGDLLIANARPLELCTHGDQFSKVLLSYADSLYFDLQFRRALVSHYENRHVLKLLLPFLVQHFYKEALQVAQTGQDHTTEVI